MNVKLAGDRMVRDTHQGGGSSHTLLQKFFARFLLPGTQLVRLFLIACPVSYRGSYPLNLCAAACVRLPGLLRLA